MAKLVDALCSGRSVRKDVMVRIHSWAQRPRLNKVEAGLFAFGALQTLFAKAQEAKSPTADAGGRGLLGKPPAGVFGSLNNNPFLGTKAPNDKLGVFAFSSMTSVLVHADECKNRHAVAGRAFG